MKLVHTLNMIHEPESASTAQARRREERVTQILDATLAVVLEHGVEGVTIQRMAKILRWSVGALYRYFPGKEAVLAELQIRVLTELGDSVVSALDAALESPARAMFPPGDRALLALLVAADTYRRFADEQPARFMLISGVIAAPRGVLQGQEAEAVGAALGALLDRVTRLVETAVEAGALQPGLAPARTLILWSSLTGLLQMRKLARLDPRLEDLPAVVLLAVETLLLGWGAPVTSLVFLRPFVS